MKRCMLLASVAFTTVTAPVAAQSVAGTVPASQAEGGTQENAPAALETPPVSEIVVTGIRASLKAAQDIKRKSDFLVDAISSEDIGKFPSRNVAEALQEIPGVAITRSGGEGQKITVRGLGPEFNTVLWNGRRLATDSTDRSFNFDTISSDLISGTEVYKSTNVALQDGGIGATIDLKTIRPLDLKKDVEGVVSARGQYDKETGKFTPDAFGFFGAKLDDGRIGVLLSASYQQRKDVRQSVGTGQWNPLTLTAPAAGGVDPLTDFADGKGNGYGRYWVPATLSNDILHENRRRIGANATVQAELSDTLLLTIDGLYNRFDIKSDGISKASFGNESAIVPGSLVTDGNNVIDKYSFVNGPEYVKESFDRRSDTYAWGGNLSWKPTDRITSTLDVSGSVSKNNDGGHDKYYVVHGPNTALTIDNTGGYNTPIGIDGAIQGYDPTIFPAGSAQLAAAPPVGSNWDRNSLTGYRTWYTTLDGAQSKDSVFETRWDNKIDFDKGLLSAIRFGGSYSNQRKSLQAINSDDIGFSNYGTFGIPVPSSLLSVDNDSGFLNTANTPLSNKFINFNGNALINYLLSPAALALRDQINGLAPGTSASTILPRGYTPIYQPGQSYSVRERVFSAYAEATLHGSLMTMPFSVVGGLRYTRTREAAQSAQQSLIDILFAAGSGGTQYNTVLDPNLAPVTQSSHYDDWLPSVNGKLDITDKLIFRSAISRSLTRPSVGDLNPVIVYPATLRPSELTASGGNGNLKPYTSWNFDAALEWYFAKAGYLSASFFTKKIDGLIVSSIVPYTVTIPNASGIADENISGQSAQFALSRFINLGASHVSGVELAARVPFSLLPSVLKYTGITTSVTLPWTDAKFNNSSFNNNGAFPGVSKSYFVSAFYDDGRIQATVTWSRRNKYYAGMLTATEPVYTLGRSQLDARASFDVTPTLQVFADAYNFTNAPTRQVGRYSNEFVLYQEDGSSYDLGVRLKF